MCHVCSARGWSVSCGATTVCCVDKKGWGRPSGCWGLHGKSVVLGVGGAHKAFLCMTQGHNSTARSAAALLDEHSLPCHANTPAYLPPLSPAPGLSCTGPKLRLSKLLLLPRCRPFTATCQPRVWGWLLLTEGCAVCLGSFGPVADQPSMPVAGLSRGLAAVLVRLHCFPRAAEELLLTMSWGWQRPRA